jgi:hypothetical protein
MVPEKYRDTLMLEPCEARLKPNEKLAMEVSFLPSKRKQYKIPFELSVSELTETRQDPAGYY